MYIIKLVHLIFELGNLKRLYRSGWMRAGVDPRETVAGHKLRTAQIGFMLAVMEGANPEKVGCMLLIHDNPEDRVGDPDRIACKYLNFREALRKAFRDQIKGIGKENEHLWLTYYDEFEAQETKEAIVAKDADMLEMAFQAKEYVDIGYRACQAWIDDVAKRLKTESAKKIFKEMTTTEFTAWWQK